MIDLRSDTINKIKRYNFAEANEILSKIKVQAEIIFGKTKIICDRCSKF